jgi:predicted pyridoxine 5'-phosphate oxidase superfamily flavin-nucleotide-binding protein
MNDFPFHEDETAAQIRAGVTVDGAGIRPFMLEQHRSFFAGLRYVFVSVPDREGWPLATVLSGPTGFVHAPTPTALRIDAVPVRHDPAAAGFAVDNEIGMLGLDLATRRRNRANGRVSTIGQSGFSIAVAQSFGNCAQYIQARAIRADKARDPAERSATIDGLDDDARRLIGASDTFFVASRSRVDPSEAGGLDISHRGGRPGFVRVEDDTLFIPDFKGNRFFNTLGNLLGDPRAGLLFIDFETGDVLQATGIVTIDWDAGAATLPSGAQRYWRVTIHRSWRRRGALPFVWSFERYAPTTLATGVW